MARFLASVSRDIPWHVTAFHKDYRMTDPDATSPRTLIRAAEIGTAEGLRFIYAGNLPGQVGPWENTRCPGCGESLIERYGYLIRSYRLTGDGCCPQCRTQLPGIWPGNPEAVRTGNDRAAYARRMPRPVAPGGDSPPAARTVYSLPLVDRTRSASPDTGGYRSMAIATPTATGPRPARSPRPELTAQQQHDLVGAARAIVRGLVLGQPATRADALAELAEQLVAGAFISLKRGKHLRTCCGMLGQPIPLFVALQESATRTVWEDVRFPPLSPSELDHVNMEVWLLHSPEPVQATGDQRAEAVIVGKHGIQVVRGGQHGLFLPSVALEHQWDSRRFLDQVCLKAGLQASAWHDDATALFVFEGEVLRGPLADDSASPAQPDAPRRGVPVRRPPRLCELLLRQHRRDPRWSDAESLLPGRSGRQRQRRDPDLAAARRRRHP